MKRLNRWTLLSLACCWPALAPAQLQLVPTREPQAVFAGTARKILLVIHNAGRQTVETEIYTRLFQTTSATAVRLGESLWKKLQILPGQTVLESAQLNFPRVNAETKFFVQWLENTNRVIGVTQVQVYPTNLLEALQPLAENQSLGVFDPLDQLKPLLKNVEVDFVDLGNAELEHFPGKLAVIGPFASKSQVPDGLTKQIKILAKKGVAVVWILPPDSSQELQPSFYLVPKGPGVVVVAQADMVSDLATKPESQLNLLYFCGLALHPQFFTLPDLSLQP